MSTESLGEPVLSAGDSLKNIFGFVEKKLPALDDAVDVPAELHKKMEEFARGQIPQEEIEKLCGQILSSPESIRAFAEILSRND